MHTLRIGMLGAGPAAQAIHLPTLSGLPGTQVTRVMDVDPILAEAVAAPLGARACGSVEELLGGEGIDIVVIGSPNGFHAEQIQAACAAGVRGILAEKPLATTPAEAAAVAAAVTRSGAALVVGAMHTYDPAWLAASGQFLDPGPFHVRSVIHLPANSRFEEMATTMVRPRPADRPAATPEEQLRGGVLGLAVHDLPLIRRFLPVIDEVRFAALNRPWGYLITGTGPAGTVELIARTGGTWLPDWTLSVWGETDELELGFPPSYVQAGSATATITRRGGAATWGPFPDSDYREQWLELLAILDGAQPRYPLPALLADLDYAFGIADLAVAGLQRAQEAA